MADLYLDWKDDLQVTLGGDLLLVDGPDLTRQAIIRRLLTAVKGYIWHLEYGAGLPQRIGKVALTVRIQSIVSAQMMLEKTVARLPRPKTTVKTTQDPNTFVIDILYTDAVTGDAVQITFDTAGRTTRA